MKRLILLGFAVLGIVAAAPVYAKTVTVTITAAGYVPKTESIVIGDAVTFTNGTTAAHTVVLKPATGFSCSGSLAIQPAQSATCTFNTAAKYAVSDATNKTAGFKGTITVARAGVAVTAQTAPSAATYGAQITVSGTIASGQANEKVTIQGQECGANAMKNVGTATTTTGGSFKFVTQPSRNTTYQAKYKTSTSSTTVEKLRPRVTLRKLARHKYNVRVLADDSFAGKAVVFQRFVKSQGRWVRVKTVFLKVGGGSTTPINPTDVSTVTFRSRIRARLSVRAVLTQSQVGACYLATRSNVIRS
jgi:plastocyanin